MYQPKTLVDPIWRESALELIMMYVVALVGAVHLLDMHWFLAMLVAPFIMGAALLAIIVVIHTLWLIVVGIDKLGAKLGIRKSPLS